MKRIYLDYSASTPVDAQVLERMLPYLREQFGNASSVHGSGREANVAIEQAREQVAQVLNASAAEIVFTSGGTEADNLAILGFAENFDEPRHMITSAVEHPAVSNACKALERKGWQITYVLPDEDGLIYADKVAQEIRSETALISIMHVNNEIGTINPVAEIAAMAVERNIAFHTDAVQSFGKLPIDITKMPVTLLSFSGHKIYGPKGSGGLFVRRGTTLKPMLFGGHQERDRRAGTENTPAIVGLGYAAELAVSRMQQDALHLRELSQYFLKNLKLFAPMAALNGHPKDRLPGVLNVSFLDRDSLTLATRLDLAGIAVSNGSACSSGSVEPSRVLQAMGLPKERSTSALRISFGRPTTVAEIDHALAAFKKIFASPKVAEPLAAVV
jgi:cysteine desulfurase